MIEQSLCYCKLDLLKAEATSKKPIHFRLNGVLGGAEDIIRV